MIRAFAQTRDLNCDMIDINQSIESFERDNAENGKSIYSCKERKLKNLIGFWILGLCNNYAYVIMLSAAFDLLGKHKATSHFCNEISTGAILLADILPALGIKLVSPVLNINVNIRVFIAIVLSAASFLLTSLSVSHWMIFTGVICAAFSSGLGEVTFLSLSSYFHKDVVSSWSSGTGGAGVVGAFSYAFFANKLGPTTTLQIMLIFPILMAISFWFIIDHTPVTYSRCKMLGCSSELEPIIDLCMKQTVPTYSLKKKLSLVKPLIKYMVPLGLVYFAEYFINQALMELLYFESNSLKLEHKDQYRWYQAIYQIGVFISRSSVNLFQINKLWILPILQVINLVFLLFEAYYTFLPSIWIVFAIIFYEGLLGGSAYVNTFYKISEEIPEEHRDFSMGVASLGDSMGIALAGAVSLPVHDALCRMHS